MDAFQFDKILPGTLVRHKSNPSDVYVVTQHFGTRITAVRTVDMTNPIEWEIVRIKGITEEAKPVPFVG
jgi:hypothetical protein